MYQFAHLLNRSETHDVIFQTADGAVRAGFCKTLLLGVSEVWNSRDENWHETYDSQGRIIHTVDLRSMAAMDAESAQDVLSALQAAVFTGELTQCSLKVLLGVARLADAELMPAVMDLVWNALNNMGIEAAQTEVPGQDVKWLEAAVGHITQLQEWVRDMSAALVRPLVELPCSEHAGGLLMALLLTELPANSFAALGVMKAAWPKLARGFSVLPQDAVYGCQAAVMRHKQVLLDHPDRLFLTGTQVQLDTSNDQHISHVLRTIAHSYLGSPADALSSDEAFEAFCHKVFEPQPIKQLWGLAVPRAA